MNYITIATILRRNKFKKNILQVILFEKLKRLNQIHLFKNICLLRTIYPYKTLTKKLHSTLKK
jgi:hypothetical protein